MYIQKEHIVNILLKSIHRQRKLADARRRKLSLEDKEEEAEVDLQIQMNLFEGV